jgi:hypothetical protein
MSGDNPKARKVNRACPGTGTASHTDLRSSTVMFPDAWGAVPPTPPSPLRGTITTRGEAGAPRREATVVGA